MMILKFNKLIVHYPRTYSLYHKLCHAIEGVIIADMRRCCQPISDRVAVARNL